MRKTTLMVALVIIALLFLYFLYPKPSASHGDIEAVAESSVLSEEIVLIAPKIVPEKPPVAKNKEVYQLSHDNLGSCEEYRPLVAQYDWDVEKVLRIMKAESGCNPNALNNNPSTGDYSTGLMQINLYGSMRNTRPSEESLKIPEVNVEFAYKLYSRKGNFSDWTTSFGL